MLLDLTMLLQRPGSVVVRVRLAQRGRRPERATLQLDQTRTRIVFRIRHTEHPWLGDLGQGAGAAGMDRRFSKEPSSCNQLSSSGLSLKFKRPGTPAKLSTFSMCIRKRCEIGRWSMKESNDSSQLIPRGNTLPLLPRTTSI